MPALEALEIHFSGLRLSLVHPPALCMELPWRGMKWFVTSRPKMTAVLTGDKEEGKARLLWKPSQGGLPWTSGRAGLGTGGGEVGGAFHFLHKSD